MKNCLQLIHSRAVGRSENPKGGGEGFTPEEKEEGMRGRGMVRRGKIQFRLMDLKTGK